MTILKSFPYMFGNLRWEDLSEAEDRQRVVLLLPLGSTEAHGPHAPLSTDATISLEVCLMSAEKLARRNHRAFVLPPLSYAVTECASQFPGTISISPEVDTRLISDICLSLVGGGFKKICIFNSHFEPVHVQCIYEAIDRVKEISGVGVAFTDITRKKYSSRLVDIAFTDITRKKYSSRLVDVFQMGESHADRYETSLVMAIDPGLINEERRKTLPRLPVNLVEKLFEQGLSKFKEFGMPAAYCGDPASASVEEGQMILGRLSDFVLEDVEGLILKKVTQTQRGLYGRQKHGKGQ